MNRFAPTVRVLFDDPADGAWNMAVDDSIATTAATTGTATLRFYRWEPATLSLGYFQPIAERSRHSASGDCPVVRRGTGGGAILHDRELTYSFACRSKMGAHGAAEGLYDLFHDTLRDTLRSLGVPVTRQPETDRSRDDAFLCFQRRARGDLVLANNSGSENDSSGLGDAKIVGSAQRRTRGALLQHGSILLAKSDFAPELPGIAETTGVSLDPSALARRWLDGLSAAAGWAIEEGDLERSERTLAHQEAERRYRSDPWTAKR